MFYNTGIATYIWVLTNRKANNRKGKVQLIDASGWYEPLRKNLGNKNCIFSDEHIRVICDLLLEFKQTEQSKIFPNEAFGYSKIIVERPLRLRVDLTKENIDQFIIKCREAKDQPLGNLIETVAERIGHGPHIDFNSFLETAEADADKHNVKLTAKRKKMLQNDLAVTDESAQPVIKKIHKSGKVEANPLYGLFEVDIDVIKYVVEYETDNNLRDSEQVPLLEDGGIEAFFKREVLPYVSDAWIDESKTQIGYQISFTKHFYKLAPLRTLEEIKADISALEKETEGLLEQIVGEEVK